MSALYLCGEKNDAAFEALKILRKKLPQWLTRDASYCEHSFGREWFLATKIQDSRSTSMAFRWLGRLKEIIKILKTIVLSASNLKHKYKS